MDRYVVKFLVHKRVRRDYGVTETEIHTLSSYNVKESDLELIKNYVIELGGQAITGDFSKPKPVRCIETGKVYRNANHAEICTGVNSQYIKNAIRGKQKTAGGFHWEFV